MQATKIVCPECRGHRNLVIPIANSKGETIETLITCTVCKGSGEVYAYPYVAASYKKEIWEARLNFALAGIFSLITLCFIVIGLEDLPFLCFATVLFVCTAAVLVGALKSNSKASRAKRIMENLRGTPKEKPKRGLQNILEDNDWDDGEISLDDLLKKRS